MAATQSRNFGSFVSSIQGANRIGTTRAQVKGSVSTEFQNQVNRNDLQNQIIEGFKIGQMSLNQAVGMKEVESMGQVIQTLTLFDSTDAFTAVMPKRQTPLLRTSMDIVSYLPTVTMPYPERTRAHTVQQRRTRIFATLDRFAIALEATYDSLDDSNGMEAYEHGLQQMVNAAIEGDAMRMLAELQTCHTPFRNPLTRYGNKGDLLTVAHLKEAFDLERQFWGIAQKTGNCMEKIEALIKPIQTRLRGRGNTYIMSSNLITHQNLIIPENTMMFLGGEQAVRNYRNGARDVRAGPDGTAIIGFRGYDISNNAPAIEPFTEYIEYMEFNHWRDIEANQPGNVNASTARRCAAIFDVDLDDWKVITADEIIDGCFRFNPQTGAPYGIESDTVRGRHKINYPGNLLQDSFHTRTPAGLRPILINVAIDKAHFTHKQAREKAGVGAALKIAGLPADHEDIIQRGLDLLDTMDKVPITAKLITDAAAEVRDAGVALNPTNKFSSLYSGYTIATEASKGNPPLTKELGHPVLNGNWAGLNRIAASVASSQANSTDNANAAIATYAKTEGYSFETVETIVNFVRLVKTVVRSVRQFYPMSLAVDPKWASPWNSNTPEAAFFENVIDPRPRLPLVKGNVITGLVATSSAAKNLPAGLGVLNPSTRKTMDSGSVARALAAIADGNPPVDVPTALYPASGTMTSGLHSVPVVQNIISSTGGAVYSEVETQSQASEGFELASGEPGQRRSAVSDLSRGGKRIATSPFTSEERALAADLSTTTARENWENADLDTSLMHVERWMLKAYYMNLFNGKALKIAAARDMPLPFSALLFRQATIASDTIISTSLCKISEDITNTHAEVQSGDVGYQYMGHPMYKFSCDGKLGVLSAQFSYYYKAKVTKPENVFQIDNVYLHGYYGGFGTQFMKEENRNTVNISDKQAFSLGRRSIFCSLEPYNRGPCGPFLSITGLKRDIGARYGVNVDDANIMDFNAPYFNAVYGFQAALHGLIHSNRAGRDSFFPGSSPIVAFQGCTKYWRDTDQDYTATELPRGYIPPEWYGPGLAATLNGNLVGAPDAKHHALIK